MIFSLSLGLAFLSVGAGPSTKPSAQDVVREIREIGGGVIRDESAPLRPVIGVKLDRCRVTPDLLSNLGAFDKLEDLDLSGVSVTDAQFERITELTNLRSLHFFGEQLHDAAFSRLSRLKNLQELDAQRLWGPKNFAVLASLSHVHDLAVTGCALKSDDLDRLAELKGLQSLDLSGTRILPRDLERLGKIASLRSIHMDCNGRFSDADLASLASIPQLEELSFRAGDITITGIRELKALPNLRRLTLISVRIDPAVLHVIAEFSNLEAVYLNHIDDDTAVGLEALKNLRELRIWGNKLTDKGMKHLKRFANLRVLGLECTRISGDGFSEIPDLKDLEELYLFQARVTDASLSKLAACGQLQVLDLTATHITDVGIENLGPLPKLRILRLPGGVRGHGMGAISRLTSLEELEMDCSDISAESLRLLQLLPRLKTLSICGDRLDSAAREELKKLKNLRELTLWYVSGSPVSEDAKQRTMNELRQAMPDTRVLPH